MSAQETIDLNADLGEGAAADKLIIGLLSSANISCGGHTGDETTMRAAIERAAEAGVTIGAHPGHEDRESFGRREIPVTPDYVRRLVATQVARLESVAASRHASVRYVKLHGALYHQVSRDLRLAEAAIDAVVSRPNRLAVLGWPGSQLQLAADRAGVHFFREAFVDRAYLANGSLAPRSTSGALLTDTQLVAQQAINLVGGATTCLDGGRLKIECDSLCLHGDGRNAAELAQAVSKALRQAGVRIRAFMRQDDSERQADA